MGMQTYKQLLTLAAVFTWQLDVQNADGGSSVDDNDHVVHHFTGEPEVVTEVNTEPPDIHGIEDSFVRDVTEQFHRYCPYTQLCTIDLPLFLSPDGTTESCCAPCECARACLETRSCCPDAMPGPGEDKTFAGIQSNMECIPIQKARYGAASTDGARVIGRCPHSFADESVKTKCETDYYNKFSPLDDRSVILPVTDTISLKTYKNKYCAMCYGKAATGLVFWKASAECRTQTRSSGVHYDASHETIRDPINNCFQMKFIVPEDLVQISSAIDECKTDIDACNVTGSWVEYDHVVDRACQSYRSTYGGYKNIHCFICNGNNESKIQQTCIKETDKFGASSFIFLLDFNDLEQIEQGEMVEDRSDDCPNDSIYDRYTDACLQLSCPAVTTLWNGHCKPMFKKFLKPIAFDVVFRLIPDTKDKLHMTALWEMRNTVFSSMIGSVHDTPTTGMHICNIEMFVKFPEAKAEQLVQLVSDSDNMYTTNIKYIGVRARIQLDSNRDVEEVILSVMDIIQNMELAYTNWTMQFSQFDNVLFQNSNIIYPVMHPMFDKPHSQPHGLYDNIMTPIAWYSLTYAFLDPVDGLAVNPFQPLLLYAKMPDLCIYAIELTPGYLIPRVKISADTLNPNVTLADVIHDLRLNVSDIVFSETSNGSRLLVSEAEYLNGVSQYFNENRRQQSKYSTEVIVSVVCSVVSLTSLIVTFVTYCVFSSLRTIPGVNNMALVLSLFLTQVLYLVGGTVYIKSAQLCEGIGMSLHFVLLSSFGYMFICTFHMLRVFSSIERNTMKGNCFVIVKYALFVEISASAIVAGTVVYSLLTTDMSFTGYGGQPCYISNPEVIKFSVALPLGIVVMANFAMFLLVIIKVGKMPTIQTSRQHERNNIIIFTKLSTITGLTWSFAFIYQWVQLEVFSYLFIVFNASQGVFIMISFIINKRIFNMIKTASMQYINSWKQTQSVFLTNSFKNSRVTNTVGGSKPKELNKY